jgi:hypothetical protein
MPNLLLASVATAVPETFVNSIEFPRGAMVLSLIIFAAAIVIGIVFAIQEQDILMGFLLIVAGFMLAGIPASFGSFLLHNENQDAFVSWAEKRYGVTGLTEEQSIALYDGEPVITEDYGQLQRIEEKDGSYTISTSPVSNQELTPLDAVDAPTEEPGW